MPLFLVTDIEEVLLRTVRLICSYLIECDLLQVPVLNVEEQDNSAVLVPAGQHHGVTDLDGAADRLRGQVLKQLGILLPEAHIP